MNGGMSLSMSGIVTDANDDPDILNSTEITMAQTYKNLSVYFQDTGDTITIYAVMSATIDRSVTNPVINLNIEDMILKESATGLTARISNYDVTIVEYPTYDEITIASATVKARVYDHVLGYVDFYTVTPIKEDSVGPYEGIVRLEGANGSWAEVDFSVTGCDGVTTFNGTFDDGTTSGSFCYVPSP